MCRAPSELLAGREGWVESFLSALWELTTLQRKPDHPRETGLAKMQDGRCLTLQEGEDISQRGSSGGILKERTGSSAFKQVKMWRNSGWQEEHECWEDVNSHIFWKKLVKSPPVLCVFMESSKKGGLLHQHCWTQTCYPTKRWGACPVGLYQWPRASHVTSKS